MPETPERLGPIGQLESRATELRAEIYSRLKPWQTVQVARHPNSACTLDYVERVFTEFTEVHGDRRFGDDKAIIAGFGFFRGRAVGIVGHQKGRDTKQKIYRQIFGYAKPEGYRKALRVMQLAQSSDGRWWPSWTRLRPIPGSSPKSAAWPKPLRSICEKWRCSTRPSSW